MTTSADFRGEGAVLGKTIQVQGELTGEEDLTIDGQLRGTIHLPNQRLTVGPLGKIQANVTARDLVVYGQLHGNVQVQDRVEIKKSGSVLGDMKLARISIEDGAYFKGNIDIQVKPAAAHAAAAAGSPAVASTALPAPAKPKPAGS